VQGQAELGLGGQGVLGRIFDHSSLALLKILIFPLLLTTAPFRNNYTVIGTTALSPPPSKSNNQGAVIHFFPGKYLNATAQN
jgi:hypothetical protein